MKNLPTSSLGAMSLYKMAPSDTRTAATLGGVERASTNILRRAFALGSQALNSLAQFAKA